MSFVQVRIVLETGTLLLIMIQGLGDMVEVATGREVLRKVQVRVKNVPTV